MIIQSIHTGIAPEGKRRAILTVSPEQKAGALAGLRDFLEMNGLKASPGYEEGHLLRVRGFETDAQLEALLKQYTKEHAKEFSPKEPLLEKTLAFIPLDRGQRHPQPFRNFIRQYSTGLVGLTSMVSGLSFLKQAISGFQGAEHEVVRTKAGINVAAAGFFITASTALSVLGFSAARQSSVPELIHSLEPRLNENAPDLRDHRSALRRSLDQAKNNPWLISTIFNALGTTIKTVGHAIPSEQLRRNPFTMQDTRNLETDRMELAGSASAFVSLGFLATATPKQPRSLLGLPSFEKTEAIDPLKHRYGGLLSPFDPDNDRGSKGHVNMQVGGFLAMASNVIFGIKGALDVYAGKRRPDALGQEMVKNWPLLLILPFNLAADYLTTISKPRFVYSIDEIATETAAYLAQKLDRNTVSPETVTKQIFILSELLAQHPRVQGTSHQLREAIAGRLYLDHGYTMLSNREGVQEYQHLLDVSPFTRTSVPPAEPAQSQESKSDPSFAKKVTHQREQSTGMSLAV